jgi:hypothetical protein
MVNRVWQHLFDRGLVKTVDNFGVNGDVPSHPELLDHLANGFIADGWSVKTLVRKIVLSRAYGLSSDAVPANMEVDPADRLVWRHAPRRLTGEEIRDAMLAADGTLSRARPEGSEAKDLKVMELPNNGPLARTLVEKARASVERSIYLPLLRGLTPTSLEIFDFAEPSMVTGSRDTTTVATQALYFLNDPFVRRHALTMAERLLSHTELDDATRIDLAYRLALGRAPAAGEAERALRYLADYEAGEADVLASNAEAPDEPTDVVVADDNAAGIAGAAAAGTKADAAKQPPIDPDQVIPVDAPVKEEVIRASSPRAAAWASFCQAILGSAEFRYLR